VNRASTSDEHITACRERTLLDELQKSDDPRMRSREQAILRNYILLAGFTLLASVCSGTPAGKRLNQPPLLLQCSQPIPFRRDTN
jgi:hypothetical protein